MKRYIALLLCLSSLVIPAAYGMQESKVHHADAKEQADAKLGAQAAQALPQAILASLNNQKIIQVAVSKAGDVIAVATEDQVACYDAQGQMIGEPKRYEKISAIALSSDGRLLVVSMADGSYAEIATSGRFSSLPCKYKGAPVRTVAFNESGDFFAVLTEQGDFNGRSRQFLAVVNHLEASSTGGDWDIQLEDTNFNQISVSPDGSQLLLCNDTACWVVQKAYGLDVNDYIGATLEVKSGLWLNAQTLLLFAFDTKTLKYCSLTFDLQDKNVAKHDLSALEVDLKGAFLAEMGNRCYLALNATSSVFTNRLVLYNPVTGKEVRSYRSPLFGNDQFAIGLGGAIFAYSKETISLSDAGTSSSSSSESSSNSSASSVNAEQKRRHAQSADKKTVRQKMRDAYRDLAFLWRHDKKRFALYAAGACAVVVAGIGAIKYAKKRKVFSKLSGSLRNLRGKNNIIEEII